MLIMVCIKKQEKEGRILQVNSLLFWMSSVCGIIDEINFIDKKYCNGMAFGNNCGTVFHKTDVRVGKNYLKNTDRSKGLLK